MWNSREFCQICKGENYKSKFLELYTIHCGINSFNLFHMKSYIFFNKVNEKIYTFKTSFFLNTLTVCYDSHPVLIRFQFNQNVYALASNIFYKLWRNGWILKRIKNELLLSKLESRQSGSWPELEEFSIQEVRQKCFYKI